MRQDVRIPDETPAGGAVTWAAVALRALEAACESWVKLARVCVFVLCLAAAGAAWWWVRFW